MANYGPADLVVEYDNAGATPVDITAHVLSVNDVDVENITEEVRPLGASWAVHKTIGVGQMPEIELSGGYCQLVAWRREIWPQRRGAGLGLNRHTSPAARRRRSDLGVLDDWQHSRDAVQRGTGSG